MALPQIHSQQAKIDIGLGIFQEIKNSVQFIREYDAINIIDYQLKTFLLVMGGN